MYKGHAGNWAPDGDTHYGSQDYPAVGNRLAVIDTADLHNPRLITNLSFRAGVNAKPDVLSSDPGGTIAYLNHPAQFGNRQSGTSTYRRGKPQLRNSSCFAETTTPDWASSHRCSSVAIFRTVCERTKRFPQERARAGWEAVQARLEYCRLRAAVSTSRQVLV